MEEQSRKHQPIFKPTFRWAILLTVGTTLPIATVALYSFSRTLRTPQSPSLTTSASVSTIRAISALGYLEPQGEVIKLSAPTSVQGIGSRVSQLLVREGERVRPGQVVAILDNRSLNQAALSEAKKQVQVDQANLAKVKAGAKQGEIDAQKARIARLQVQMQWEIVSQQATIARLEAQQRTQTQSLAATVARTDAQWRNAETEKRRYQNLYQSGTISASELDSKRLSAQTASKQLSEAKANLSQIVETMPQQLNEAKANLDKIAATLQQQIKEAESNLNQITEVRPTDMQVAQAQVEHSLAAVNKAQADLDLCYIRSPIHGQVLKIYTKAGESVTDKGIAELGQTDRMVAVAEVNENNIGKVRLAQPATITSDYGAFTGNLQGTVIKIGNKIGKQDVLGTDPAADTDARVVEVKIGLASEDSQQVSGLTYAKVVVKINF